MVKAVFYLFLSFSSGFGGIYWLYIYLTKEGREKRDSIGKYTLLDRICQLLSVHITLIVCLLNFLFFGNIDVIK